MTEQTFNPFVEQEMIMSEDLEKRLFECDYFGGINRHAREVLQEFMQHVSRDIFEGIGLVQAWLIAIKDCVSNDYPNMEFPVTNPNKLPLFPLVLELMDLEPDVKYSALAVYEVLDPRYKRQPIT